MDYETKLLTEIITPPGGEPCRLTDEVPVFSDDKSAKRLNGYYTAAHDALVKGMTARLNLPPEITVKTTVTTCDGDTVSLYRDFRFGDGTVRVADNWLGGYPLSLRQLGISRRAAVALGDFQQNQRQKVRRDRAVDQCVQQAAALDRSGYATLYPDYAKRIKIAFKKDDFYIKDGNAIIFFQSGSIAPERLGLLKFTISLSQTCSRNETADA